MCEPRDLCSSITVIFDGAGQPLGATVVTHWMSDHEHVTPVDVGPFDTIMEVVAACVEGLTYQDTLW